MSTLPRPAPSWLALADWGHARRITLVVAGLVLALNVPALMAPGAGRVVSALELRAEAVARGEAWRLLTGHLVHGSADHLLLAVLAFALLGCACEPVLRRLYPAVLVSSALAMSAGLLLMGHASRAHHGLAGIDAALLLSVILRMLRDAWRSGEVR